MGERFGEQKRQEGATLPTVVRGVGVPWSVGRSLGRLVRPSVRQHGQSVDSVRDGQWFGCLSFQWAAWIRHQTPFIRVNAGSTRKRMHGATSALASHRLPCALIRRPSHPPPFPSAVLPIRRNNKDGSQR